MKRSTLLSTAPIFITVLIAFTSCDKEEIKPNVNALNSGTETGSSITAIDPAIHDFDAGDHLQVDYPIGVNHDIRDIGGNNGSTIGPIGHDNMLKNHDEEVPPVVYPPGYERLERGRPTTEASQTPTLVIK